MPCKTLRDEETYLGFLIKKETRKGLFFYNSAPCYFPTNECSIVTATRLDCCVRNGNRYNPRAMGTDLGLCTRKFIYSLSWLSNLRAGESRCQLTVLRSSPYLSTARPNARSCLSASSSYKARGLCKRFCRCPIY